MALRNRPPRISSLRQACWLAAFAAGYAFLWTPLLATAETGKVPFPERAERVASFAPALTEMVFAHGAGDRLVGRTDYCMYPAAVAAVPKVGGYYDPRIEALVRQRPDLVLAMDRQTWLLRRCRELGIATLPVDLRSLKGIVAACHATAHAMGVPASAGSALEAELEDLPTDRRGSVLWIMSRDPGSLSGMYGMGPFGHRQELLRKVGYDNVLATQRLESPTVTRELILSLRPDFILDDLSLHPGTDAERRERAKAVWVPMLALPELKGTRLCMFTDGRVNLPGPRVVKGFRVVLAEMQRNEPK